MLEDAYFDPGYFDPGYFGGVIDAGPGPGPDPESYGTELGAFVAAWDATPALLDAMGPLQLAVADERSPLPYSTSFLVSRARDGVAGKAWRSTVQISIHASTAGECEGLARPVRKAFHKARLPIGDGRTGHCLGVAEYVAPGEGKAPDGSDCWMQMIEFDLLFFGSLDV